MQSTVETEVDLSFRRGRLFSISAEMQQLTVFCSVNYDKYEEII